MNISPAKKLNCTLHCTDRGGHRTIENHKDLIVNLARLASLDFSATAERPKASATAVVADVTIFVSLEGIVDVAKESERLEKEIAKLAKDIDAMTQKLNNQQFVRKAPAAVVADVRQRQADLLEKKQRLQANLDKIKSVEI
jgi:valyl-tRNA synthetase